MFLFVFILALGVAGFSWIGFSSVKIGLQYGAISFVGFLLFFFLFKLFIHVLLPIAFLALACYGGYMLWLKYAK